MTAPHDQQDEALPIQPGHVMTREKFERTRALEHYSRLARELEEQE